ncbi:MAG TPA: GAF domain-containing protein [Anaerolineae bacterium]|nr:GAF domain-containing protein [Anaerolineae bacterium]HQK12825.1 GAF domain-containing protein [Anaerolineae bacterium]
MAKARIFLVEDEMIVAEVLRMNLERSGYEVVGHELYGEAVVESVARSKPHLILMDIRLKGKMDGIAAAAQVQARFDIPIIYLTAYGDMETLQRAKKTAPYGYLIKPFEIETLRSTIEMTLNKHDLERRLAASESRVRQIIEQLPYPMIVFAPDGIATLVNHAFLALFDLPSADVLVGQFNALGDMIIHRLGLQAVLARVFRGETVQPFEVQLDLKEINSAYRSESPTQVVVIITLFAVRNPEGEINQVVGILQDTTARKKAEEALQHHNRQLQALNKTTQALTSTLSLEQVLEQMMHEVRTLLEAEAASVLLYDPDSDTLTFAAAVGPNSQSLVGTRMPATAGIAGESLRTRQALLIRDAYQDPRFYNQIDARTGLRTRSLLAVPLITKEKVIGVAEAMNWGDKLFNEDDLNLLNTLAGSAAAAIENARLYTEITHRLAESRLLQEIILAAASSLDFDEVVRRVLQTIHQTLHPHSLSLAFPDPQGEYMIIHPSIIGVKVDTPETLRLPMHQSVTGQVYTSGQSVLIHDTYAIPNYYKLQNDVELCSELAVPVRMDDQVVAVLNIEDQRLHAFTEDDLRLYETIAAQLGIALKNARLYAAEREQRRLVEQTTEQLVHSEKLAATGRLAAALAHEINNPLQTIHSSLEMLLMFSLEPEQQREYIQIADEEVQRLIGLVTRILEFARKPRREPHSVQIHTVVNHVLSLVNKYMQHRNMRIEHDVPVDLPVVRADEGELGQVFMNLILNAIDAMDEGGLLRIQGNVTDDGYVAISFTDNGRGIPPEDMRHLFEPFFTTKQKGAGMGLNISYDLVRQYNGDIIVQSQVGQGSTFTVRLPIP